ncbi:S-layer homology domain-containing protein [Paenibacillus dokdonensis]|uniref:S-layer homology domain-containing protein n=1 Tax=Paenibacillus dokdonensis TaxID=2567944 RepID=A0ABU6GNT6_9BACL|nr:immunoglobulin-like domain-containing protein [Paenibacillus dokdonensis]MEC0241064.1 S-layer homology domain-containing protein [Paenibacillus dokdonensis]
MIKRKLISCLLVIALVCLQASHLFISVGYAQTDTQNYLTFKYDQLNQDGRLKLNGNSAIVNNVLRLTPSQSGQWGTVFNNNRISLSNNKSFSAYFEFNMTKGSGQVVNGKPWTWADGLVFTVQTTSNGAGGLGSGLGYAGIGKSVGVEFDTFRNGPDIGNLGDPAGLGENAKDSLYTNHTAVDINGAVNHTVQKEATSTTSYVGDYRNLDSTPDIRMRQNTATQHAWIDYNGEDKSLEVRMSTTDNRPQGYVLRKTGLDLTNILQSDDVYVGFTASTGSAWQEHNVTKWYFANTYSPIDIHSQTYLEAPKRVSFTPAAEADQRVKLDISTLAVNDTPAGNIPLTIKVDNPDVRIVKDHVTTGNDGKAFTYLISDKQITTKVRIEGPGGIFAEKMVAISPYVNPNLSLSEPVLQEAPENDGSIAGQQIIYISSGMFSPDIQASDVKVNNLPSGLTPSVVPSGDGKSITVSFTGQAAYHSKEFSTNRVSLTINKAAITGATKDLTTPVFSIGFADPARIHVQEGEIAEVPDFSHGWVQGSLNVSIENGIFAADIATGDVSLEPMPGGMDKPSVSFVDPSHITVTFDTHANDHENVNDLMSSLVVDAGKVVGSNGYKLTSNTFKINFNEPEPYLLVQTPALHESDDNDGALSESANTIVAVLQHASFNRPLTVQDIQIDKLPPGLEVGSVSSTEHELSITLTGKALEHSAANSVSDIVLSVAKECIDPNEDSMEVPGEKITLTEDVKSNSFGVMFQDPPPTLTVTPDRIMDQPDGTIAPELTVTLSNGKFASGAETGLIVNNLPEGITYSAVQKDDQTIIVTFTGQTIVKDDVSKYASVTIQSNGIEGTENSLTSNSFYLDVPSQNTVVQLDKNMLDVIYQDGDSRTSVTSDVGLKTSGANGSQITWTSSDSGVIGADGTVVRPADGKTVTLTATITNGDATDTKTFTLFVKARPKTDQESVELDKADLNIGYHEGEEENNVASDVELPTHGEHGTDIVWTSEPEGYVDPSTGKVTRPAYDQGDQTITLKATVTKGDATETKEFTLIVKAKPMTDQESVERDKTDLNIVYREGEDKNNVASDLELPKHGEHGTDIVWTSEPEGYVDPATGKVTRPASGQGDQTITLKATVKKGDATETKEFTLIVKAEATAPGNGQGSGTGGGSGGSNPSSTPTPTPQPETETITLNVQVGKGSQFENAAKTTITRTSLPDKTKKDTVNYTQSQAEETVKMAQANGSTTARLFIPDAKDEVSSVDVNISKDAIEKLVSAGLDLAIYTENAQIYLSAESLKGLTKDLYFRVVPIKKEDERKQVETRAKQEKVVREVLGNGSIYVVGRPMTIETNMSSRAVKIMLPLDPSSIPSGTAERERFMSNLAVFIEHSDGERVLVKPEIATYDEDRMGLSFNITKFSTFTIVNIDNLAQYLKDHGQSLGQAGNIGSGTSAADSEGNHRAYIKGYPDGTFKPEKSLTRAEMATMLTRVGTGKAGILEPVNYPDMTATHWAKDTVLEMTKTGLMKGFPDGRFGPERSITRAEMAAIVTRWLGLEEGAETSTASDMKDIRGHWAEKDLKLVIQAGIMKGMPDSTFRPEKPLTRAEAVTVLNRILKRGPLEGVVVPTWKDAPSKHWAYRDIEEASQDHYFTRTSMGNEQIKLGPSAVVK